MQSASRTTVWDLGGSGTYANRDILGCCEDPVQQDSHEGRVKTKLNRQVGQLSVGHTLGDDNSTDGDT